MTCIGRLLPVGTIFTVQKALPLMSEDGLIIRAVAPV